LASLAWAKTWLRLTIGPRPTRQLVGVVRREQVMNSRVKPAHRVARLAATVLIASVVSLGTGAAASAQPLKPEVPPKGVSLEQALAAAQALSGPQPRGAAAALDRAAPIGGGGIVAVFIAPAQT